MESLTAEWSDLFISTSQRLIALLDAYSALSVPNPLKFIKDCRRLEQRTTLAYFGLDFIIDRQGTIHCIEINGQNSGSKGFSKAYGADLVQERALQLLASFGLPVTMYTSTTQKSGEKESRAVSCASETAVPPKVAIVDLERIALDCSKAAFKMAFGVSLSDEQYFFRRAAISPLDLETLDTHFRPLFIDRIPELCPGGIFWNEEPIGLYSMGDAEGIVWAHTERLDPFDENRFLLLNPYKVELAVRDKVLSAILLPREAGVASLPFIYPFQRAELRPGNSLLEKYVQSIPSKKVVMKPTDSCQGIGVVVIDKSRFLNWRGQLQEEVGDWLVHPAGYFADEQLIEQLKTAGTFSRLLLQPFVESKPFYLPETGKKHRGCIRYAVLAHSDKGSIKVAPLGGYVRLAPEPRGSALKSYVANFSQEAHAIPLPEEDRQLLERWIDAYFPVFYRRALRLDANFGYDARNCVRVEAFDKSLSPVVARRE